MRRGTTPTLTLTVEWIDDLTKFKNIVFALRQGYTLITLDQNDEDMVVSADKIAIHLSQEETLKLSPLRDVKMQLKFLTEDDEVYATNIIKTSVSDILDESVLT